MNIGSAILDALPEDERELNDFLGPEDDETPDEKYARLKKKEQELHERQKILEGESKEVSRFPNWPPFIPIVYANLEREIPITAHGCVKTSMYTVLCTVVTAIFNVCAVCFVQGLRGYSLTQNVILASVQGFGLIYFTRTWAFKKLYNGCRHHDVPMVWTAVQIVILGWNLFLFSGFRNSGSAGLATFLDLMAKNKYILSISLSFVDTCLYIVTIALNLATLKLGNEYQKISGIDVTGLNRPIDNPFEEKNSEI